MVDGAHGRDDAQLKRVVSVRFSAEEAERLRAMADREGEAVSTLIRRTVLANPRWNATERPADGANARVTSVEGSYTIWSGSEVEVVDAGEDANREYAPPFIEALLT